MVLAELGRKITGALQKLSKTTVIDEEAVKACLQEICNALLGSDIDVRYVMKLRENILKKFKNE
jgi:signal recognition particle subunit SRP54